MKIVVLAVGRLRPPYADVVEHYRKLLAGHARVEMIEVREGDQVGRRLPRASAGAAGGSRSFVSLLDREGETLDSLEFARFLEDRRQAGRDLCFVVGGPYGLEIEGVDHRLSFGPLTLPHQLARVVLLEQLYRAHKILAREPYHY